MKKELLVADCETDPFDGKSQISPFLWGLTDGVNYREFETVDEFVEFVADLDAVIYAHNGGKFDWLFLLHHVEEFEPLTIINGRVAKFRIGRCEFRDSWNILPEKLENLAADSNWKQQFDYSILAKDKRHLPENWQRIRDYLREDCFNLWKRVNQFIETYGFKLTLAGTAMSFWQKMSGIKADRSNAQFYNDIAPFYYGGRTQCFEKGIITQPFSVVDINSAYPRAMKEKHPWGLVFADTDRLPDTDDEISRCFIEVECMSFGAFPYRTEKGQLIFPSDDVIRTYKVTGWEYLAALETCSIHLPKIKRVIEFFDTIDFCEYIDYFYAMKQAASKESAEYIFAKLFLNSLYGKFGSNPQNYMEYTVLPGDCGHDALKADGYMPAGELDNGKIIVARELDEEKQRFFNVAVSASITGYVRANLWRQLARCTRPLYCDTDSIAAIETGPIRISKELGDWSCENNGGLFKQGAIAGKKMYAFEYGEPVTKKGKTYTHKTATKGCKLNANDIYRVARGEEIVFHPEAPTMSLKFGTKYVPRKIRMT